MLILPVTLENSFLQNVRNVLGTEYTVWAALFGATFITMATNGTDQDLVQRMLTAKNATRSRLALIFSGLADLPIVLCFLSIGILLWAFYQKEGMSHPFAYYILHEMPSGIRGLMIAGVLATAMGSLSAALNALATSFTKDWYLPYVRPQATPKHVIAAARKSTVVFSAILVLIGSATAYAVIVLHSRVIPVVIGIFGYTYGSLLGVFLVGMLTKTRGSDRGNPVGMACGFIVVAILSGLHNDMWNSAASLGSRLGLLGVQSSQRPGVPALALGLAAHHRLHMADHRRNLSDSRRGFDLPHAARAREVKRESIAKWGEPII